MQFEDLKLYGINSSVFAISFTKIEMAAKLLSPYRYSPKFTKLQER